MNISTPKHVEEDKTLKRKTSLVEIHFQDDKNSRAIMATIYTENIRDEEKIRALVQGFTFSSAKTKQYISDRTIDLLRTGVFNSPPPEAIIFHAVNTDASELLNSSPPLADPYDKPESNLS